ncbi:MAG: TIM-barrel domain-containing protein, partial [Terriglobales bacterium]
MSTGVAGAAITIMKTNMARRGALKTLAAGGAGLWLAKPLAALAGGTAFGPIRFAGQRAELRLTAVTGRTLRISIAALDGERDRAAGGDGALLPAITPLGAAARRLPLEEPRTAAVGAFTVRLSPQPLALEILAGGGRLRQRLRFDDDGAMAWRLGTAPVGGLGEGGAQFAPGGGFDRRGSLYRMRNGEFGGELAHEGARMPVPFVMSAAAGWALFVHAPRGTFDLRGGSASAADGEAEGWFHADGAADEYPRRPAASAAATSPLPLDVFLTLDADPAALLAEYARLTSFPALPPLWAFGFQQSHRTLESAEQVLEIARTYRAKRLPCDALIYLGTGFTPSGWNTANGSFDFNPRIFPDPKAALAALHAEHFKVVLHAVILAPSLSGSASDPCPVARFDDRQAGCYWDEHRRDFALGVDGWWADEGDGLDPASRLNRIRMYWQGQQLDRPNRRPYLLTRNGYAGMQRYAPLLWSGDITSQWETLRTQVAVGLNAGLTGLPFWGTDIGGFYPTPEFTAELYLRWFQFGAFCPLFRCHGRAWMLRLPWGWDLGATGPGEMGRDGARVLPPATALHDTSVEPICRQYLNLRYRLLPYIYSYAYQAHRTGLPLMRPLWMHAPGDARAERGDEYFWGRELLVAPVLEAGARTRRVYLPAGAWYDFWTESRVAGGREIARDVDLATMPLYVRAGAIVPLGPVKQYTAEPVEGPLELVIYPGADGEFLLFEDDGVSFDYRRGAWMGLRLRWQNGARTLAVALARGSRLLPPAPRELSVR